MAEDRNVRMMFSATDNASAVFSQLEKGLNGLGGQFLTVRGLIGTFAAGLGVQQFASMILGATEAIAKYKDLGIVAGSTAEKISGFEEPARTAGISIESVAQSVAHLGRTIGEARLGDVGKRSLLEALGIDPDDGRDAADVYVDVAKAVSGMTDQTVAAKVSNDLLGKSYREVRVFLSELSEQQQLTARVTNEQAEAADRFRDNLARAGLAIDNVKIALGNEFLPTLNKIADAFMRAQKEGGLLAGALEAIRTALTGTEQFKNDKALYELTSKQFELENKLMALRAAQREGRALSGTAGVIKRLEADLAAVNAQLQTTLTYRKELERQAAPPPTATGGTPTDDRAARAAAAEARVRERMEFERHYAERIAQQRGFATTYAAAVQLQVVLAQEQQKQGLISQRELIEQLAVLKNSELQAQAVFLERERQLHLRKGELGQAAVAQAKINAAESARIANDAITKAQLETLDVVEQRRSSQAEIVHRKKMEEQFQRITEETATERDLLAKQLEDKRLMLEAWAGEDYVRQQIALEQIELLNLQHQARLGNIHAQGVIARRNFEQMNMRQQTQMIVGELLAMTSAVANQNKVMFRINQAAGIANAIVNTYEGVTRALAKYPPPISFIMAAAQLAAGLAAVQQIRSAQFGGSTSAPSIGGGQAVQTTPAGTTETVPPPQTQLPQGEPVVTRNVFITFSGDPGPVSQEWVRDRMIPALNDAIGSGANVMVR